MVVLANARVVTPERVLDPGWISVEDGLVTGVAGGDPARRAVAGHEVIDVGGAFVLPGFIDLHMHGGGGAAVTTADPDEILRAVAFHRRHGTTRTLASLVTAPMPEMVAATRAIAEIVRAGPSASGHVVGAHLEGPFLHPRRRGSHDPAHLLAPDPVALRALLNAGAGTVRVVTLAPELAGGMELLRDVVGAGAVAAIGHTDATYEQAAEGFRAGARLATHLFNAMRPLHHREPGAVGAAFDDESVTCELISDGLHLHDETLRLVFAAAGARRVALITDATPAAGMAEGHFHLGPVPIIARGGKVTLADGVSLAGSSLTMDAAVRHAVRHVGIDVVAAARAAATTPAQVLGVAGSVGSIEPGKEADLVVMTADLEIGAVIVAGAVVHGRVTSGQPPRVVDRDR